MRWLLRLLGLVLVAALLTSWLGFGPFIINREGELRIAKLFGSVQAVITEPGLHLALATEVPVFDGRWLHLSSGPEPKPIQTLDHEPLVVDNFTIWRIRDPLRFSERFPAGVREAQRQLNQLVKSRVREVIGRLRLAEVLARKAPDDIDLESAREAGCIGPGAPVDSERPADLTAVITARSCMVVRDFGIEIAEVRLNRTEIPSGNPEQKVYGRMRSEREELAKKYRAEGEEMARKIRATADRDAKITIERARAEATRIRGEGDAEAARIFAEAFSQDPSFYEFVRSLEVYRKTLGEGTTLVLPPDHPFLEFLLREGAAQR